MLLDDGVYLHVTQFAVFVITGSHVSIFVELVAIFAHVIEVDRFDGLDLAQFGVTVNIGVIDLLQNRPLVGFVLAIHEGLHLSHELSVAEVDEEQGLDISVVLSIQFGFRHPFLLQVELFFKETQDYVSLIDFRVTECQTSIHQSDRSDIS